jgi:hypothetical protein
MVIASGFFGIGYWRGAGGVMFVPPYESAGAFGATTGDTARLPVLGTVPRVDLITGFFAATFLAAIITSSCYL